MKQTHLVFVYGSLKHGFYNNCVLGDSKFIDTGVTAPGNVMYDLGCYPGVKRQDGCSDRVQGEVYAVDEAGMKRLDRLESNGLLYQREIVPIYTDQGVMDCWMYYYLREPYTGESKISDGIWKQVA